LTTLPPDDNSPPPGLASKIAAVATALKTALEADNSVISKLDSTRAEDKRALNDKRRQWRENIAMLEGLHYIQSLEQGLLNVGGLPRGRRFAFSDNRLGDYAERLYSRIQQVQYAPAVTTDTDQPEDRKAAKAANAGLRWFWRRRKVRREKRAVDKWLIATGEAYLEAFYDPEGGPEMLLPVLDENNEPVQEEQVGENGQPVMIEVEIPDPQNPDGPPQKIQQPATRTKMELQRIGEADFVVRSGFEVTPDSRFQDWRRIRHVFVEEVVAREDVLQRFKPAFDKQNINLEQKLPSDVKTQPTPWIPALAPGTTDLLGLPRPVPAVGGVLTLIRYYELPSAERPQGLHAIWVEGTDFFLHKGPLWKNRIPVFPLFYRARPWALGGKTPVYEGKILQRLFNRILSRFADHLVRLPAGWLLIPTNSGIPKNAFTSEIGSVIRHTPGTGAPQFIFPPFQGLMWYDKFLSRIEASFEERFQVPPVIRGEVPTGVKAARGIQLLQEAADEVQAPTLEALGDGWVDFYEFILDIMHDQYTVARLIAMEGMGKRAEIMQFQGQDIPGDWRDRLTVTVEQGESLPRSRSARRDMFLTLAKEHGFFGQVGTPEYVRKLSEVLDFDPGFIQTENDLDRTIAEDENMDMTASGKPLPIRRIDDDWVHLVEHLTDAKAKIARGQEAKAVAILAHADLHWAQFNAKQAPPAGAPAPGPGGKGGPPQPTNAMRGLALPPGAAGPPPGSPEALPAGPPPPPAAMPGAEPQESSPGPTAQPPQI